MADELKKAIEENAKGPRQATADGVTIQQHSLKDQIAADEYLSRKEAAKNPARALMRVRIIPPGTA